MYSPTATNGTPHSAMNHGTRRVQPVRDLVPRHCVRRVFLMCRRVKVMMVVSTVFPRMMSARMNGHTGEIDAVVIGNDWRRLDECHK